MNSKLYTPIRSADVRLHNGRPTLFVNGLPHDGLTYMTYNPKPENFAKFDELGVCVMSFPVTCDTHIWPHMAAPVCLGPEKYDYSKFDALLQMVAEAAPHAWLLPRVYVLPPEWWCSQHLDELVQYGEPRSMPRPGVDGQDGRFVPSFASEEWRRFGSENLARMVRHVEEGPWAGRILGYHIASGLTEEWVWWGVHEGYFPDYSQAMLKAFRAFLRKHYGSDAVLQAAWNRSGVTLDTAVLPTLEERMRARHNNIRDPRNEQHVIDYILCHSDVVAQTLCDFARAVKSALTNPRLTLAFYGYICDAGFMAYLSQNAGELGLERVLNCSDLDGLSSPSTYCHRAPGVGHSSFMTAEASVAMHGKLWFDENDYHTHNPQWSPQFFATHNAKDTLCVQRRQFSAVLQQGCAMWWFDMGGNWYDESMHKEIKRSVEIARQALNKNRSSVAEIALIIDPKSIAYMGGGSVQETMTLLNLPRKSFGRCGAPYDMYLLSDIGAARNYKLYVFMNAYHLTKEERLLIDDVVKRDGKTALWFYASGYVADKPDIASQSKMTGINQGIYTGHMRPVTVLRPGIHPIVAGLEGNQSYGEDAWFMNPFFYVDDPDAIPLGFWESDEHLALMAVKEFDNWRSIWACAPNPPSWLVRRIARWAGVHIYNEKDAAFYANQSFLAVSSNEAGRETIRLPYNASVYELFDGNREWRNVTEFSVEMPRHHTSIFFLGTQKEWKE